MKGKPTKLQLTVNVVEWMRKMIMTLDKMEKGTKTFSAYKSSHKAA